MLGEETGFLRCVMVEGGRWWMEEGRGGKEGGESAGVRAGLLTFGCFWKWLFLFGRR